MYLKAFTSLLLLLLLSYVSSSSLSLHQRVVNNLESIDDDIKAIINYVLNGAGKHHAYTALAEFVDTYGPRLCGSASYNNAVDGLLNDLQGASYDNVHGEVAKVPQWVRGDEQAALLQPRFHKMNILGLGGSVGTKNTTAPALVVKSFDELKQQAAANNTQGKIIVFNQQCDWNANPLNCYGSMAVYRVSGAVEAAKVGGVAALVRTLTGQSISSPHTGEMGYQDGVPQIPTASITVEDADMFQRMQDRGQKLVITLSMGAQTLPDADTFNVVAEIEGSIFPDQVVLVSGHLDSWDVGQGAMDDGGGAFISIEVLRILQQLNLKPKRTIRFVGWSCEEFGGVGAYQYYQSHASNASNMDLVMESDLGVFRATGIEFTGNADATAIMQTIVERYLSVINASQLVSGGDGTDIDPWMQAGVPGASLHNANEKYFWFHHSNGDTMTVLDPDEVDSAVIAWAVTAYAVASLDDMLPRGSSSPSDDDVLPIVSARRNAPSVGVAAVI